MQREPSMSTLHCAQCDASHFDTLEALCSHEIVPRTLTMPPEAVEVEATQKVDLGTS
jgi:hypothetical protein